MQGSAQDVLQCSMYACLFRFSLHDVHKERTQVPSSHLRTSQETLAQYRRMTIVSVATSAVPEVT